MPTLEILRTGPLALVQDLGRVGLADIGVTRSGAADRRSHTLANRLVANPDDRATIEVTFGGFSARVRGGNLDIAVTGADTDPRVDGILFGTNSIQHVRDGQVISLGTPHSGVRSYLAVRGGIDVTPVLGSRSYDVMSAIGPLPLQPGDVLPVGEHTDEYPELDQAPVPPICEHLVELLVVPGPRDDWLVDPDALVHTIWMVSDRSDRVGMRLEGRPLQYRSPDRVLASEGATRGAIQVPPNGLPVILGPDHPVTGGYPVVGVIADEDIDKVAQIRPGQYVRLHWSRPRAARASASSFDGGRLVHLVNQQCAHPGPHRPPGSHRRPRERGPAACLRDGQRRVRRGVHRHRLGPRAGRDACPRSGIAARSSRTERSCNDAWSTAVPRCAAATSKPWPCAKIGAVRGWQSRYSMPASKSSAAAINSVR